MRVIISSRRTGAAVTRHDKYEKIFAIERTHSGLCAIITLLNTINVIGPRDTRNARVVRASLKADPRAILRVAAASREIREMKREEGGREGECKAISRSNRRGLANNLGRDASGSPAKISETEFRFSERVNSALARHARPKAHRQSRLCRLESLWDFFSARFFQREIRRARAGGNARRNPRDYRYEP